MRRLEDWEQKLDHRLLAALDRAGRNPTEPAGTISILLRFRGDIEGLQTLPCILRTISGDVATARVRLGDVPALAQAPQIVFLELAGIEPPQH